MIKFGLRTSGQALTQRPDQLPSYILYKYRVKNVGENDTTVSEDIEQSINSVPNRDTHRKLTALIGCPALFEYLDH